MRAKRVLVLSDPGDLHAAAVIWAMKMRGAAPLLWDLGAFPSEQLIACSLDNRGSTAEWRGPDNYVSDLRCSVVWLRRPRPPRPLPATHPADQAFVRRESASAIDAVLNIACPSGLWVNPHQARQSANSKPIQLLTASKAGLRIPRTLVSNDIDAIHRFVESCGGEAVYKPFFPSEWESVDGRLRKTYTTRVTIRDLDDAQMLRLVPGCFQEILRKAFEVRLNVFGSLMIPAKIDSQSVPGFELDWRLDSGATIPILPMELPGEAATRVRRFMKLVGLHFGCLDFVVTPEGEWIFLEVNEMGQFLWVEKRQPQLRVLDAMADFLLSGRADFAGTANGATTTFDALFASEDYRSFDARRTATASPAELDFTYRE